MTDPIQLFPRLQPVPGDLHVNRIVRRPARQSVSTIKIIQIPFLTTISSDNLSRNLNPRNVNKNKKVFAMI